ncbi:hypothetical protein [Burkholderia pseudomallei]|uniref:hypothetical protein n=1 Tax=Burkholderia pseudomallei TaxID=28450 RepID=UPI00135D6325|nr:hypothetical protein [Burkholderia pseudomallei]MWA31136.1 hypothetical protein [Burkholderia pseudomallei]
MADYQTDTLGNTSGFFNPETVYAQWGDSRSGVGIGGTSATLTGVYGESKGRYAVGVYGVNNQPVGIGVRGDSNGDFAIGVAGVNTGGTAYGGVGVSGSSDLGAGVVGGSDQGVGVVAEHSRTGHFALLACEEGAAKFVGDVLVFGTLIGTGQKSFQIDHPLDPEEKFLVHASVESSEMKNIYDGMSVLDSAGEAEVKLPAWFEALNKDFRYQLTAVGSSCPNLFIAKEISENQFRIGGGVPQMKVSWQVTGIRKDVWASANPFKVEIEKSTTEKGLYIHPELHNAPKEKSIQGAIQKRLASLTEKLPPKS